MICADLCEFVRIRRICKDWSGFEIIGKDLCVFVQGFGGSFKDLQVSARICMDLQGSVKIRQDLQGFGKDP